MSRVSAASSSSSSSSPITDFDLYDLLGVDSSSDHSKIKTAYRTLQKRCHPDIAGPAGHDMAIILNEAYALLSDPMSRFSYDKEQAKVAGLRGYTGKPLYSVWFGSESEERAVFVDEVKCVGCLKCALFAEKTFAVESVYGRARVIAQWADPEDKIQEAIEACPVDCISIVERSKLAALEFLMSQQPRGNVRVGAASTGGTRVSNIFVDVDKFQDKFQEAMNKASSKHSKESDLQREARISAIQAIRAISNWLYWQPPIPGMPTSQTRMKVLQIAENSSQANVNKLREAVTARKQARESAKPNRGVSSDNVVSNEYWTPSKLVLPEATNNNSSDGSKAVQEPSSSTEKPEDNNENFVEQKKNQSSSSPFEWAIPMCTALVAAVIVRLKLGEGVAASGSGLDQHIGGSILLDIVNSSWLQVILAGVTWYLIGMAGVELIAVLGIKRRN